LIGTRGRSTRVETQSPARRPTPLADAADPCRRSAADGSNAQIAVVGRGCRDRPDSVTRSRHSFFDRKRRPRRLNHKLAVKWMIGHTANLPPVSALRPPDLGQTSCALGGHRAPRRRDHPCRPALARRRSH
jgi:hypothetical protein